MNRNLDGAYFRVKRGNGFENICFTDMTTEEIETVIGDNRPAEWWKSLALHLKDCINSIGDQLDLVNKWGEDDE